jgi:uncharacterized integral membrane protein
MAALAATVLIVPFGVANRHAVPLTFDPVGRLDSSFAYDVPLSLIMFLVFLAGLLAGAITMWLTQGRWRRTARQRTREAYRWKSEADRLARERDERVKAVAAGSGAA